MLSGETVAEIQFEMWVMHISDFVALTSLPPHQELRAAGKLVPWNASMRTVFFLSHEWTSDTHPDHTLDQLNAIRTLLIRMFCGECPDIAPDFESAVQLPSDIKISTAELKDIVR